MKLQNPARVIVEMIVASGLSPCRPLDRLNRLLEIGRWLKDHKCPRTYKSREAFYRYLNDEILGNGPLDYLEFGVWRGASIRAWLELNGDPRSRFYGFDTFSGLPEEWRVFFRPLPKGSLDAGGVTPAVSDPRVSFIRGVFQDSLPEFLKTFRVMNRLVINLDADLYSSTLYVLASLNPLLRPGTILILDEISTPEEFRAFRDFIHSFKRAYKVLAQAERIISRRTAVEIL